jgi:hypothetical protein
MSSRFLSRWPRVFYGLCVAALAFSGVAQMPIFKRYYLADIPGLGWLADFYFTHVMHYVAATAFLVFVAYLITYYLRDWKHRFRITALGALRLLVIAILIGSGLLRVLKNRPDLFFDPTTVMLLDWIHIGSALFFGILALVAVIAKRPAYLVSKS